ncbi:MAG TPA: Asp-tRNA(Asn)/Glu-tRNA(Gln) amidotransferase subunit GatB [Planctomycetota bacterium]|nr:Asp-tRNA(Asn)/Glu-tRNA(Gln) amidotransferase subunit GatB [Planctomycetota bacterium]
MTTHDDMELVCGLEVHAQLNTKTKLFCGCENAFGGEPNSRTCPVCLGLPGSLPVVNEQAFEKILRLAVAMKSRIAETMTFDRKNYYYPDLPKNYQISQDSLNLGTGGELKLINTGKTIRFHNVHLEEDAGKNVHPEGGTRDATYVDLNRAGTPLAEIVTQPDFRSVDEIDDYMHTLTQLLLTLDASNCEMQKGNLRFEASVSVRKKGDPKLGKRVEIKNLNSYAAVRNAVTHEYERQSKLLAEGGAVAQETRLWNDELGKTEVMRSKENAPDYRYFPEPDLIPFAVTKERLAMAQKDQKELPGEKAQRYMSLGVPKKIATETFQTKPWLAAYWEELTKLGVPGLEAANYCDNQIAQLVNDHGGYEEWKAKHYVPPARLAELHEVIVKGETSKDIALKQVWPKVHFEGLSPREAIKKYGLVSISPDEVRKFCQDVVAANTKMVAEIVSGKRPGAKGALVGQVMKRSGGKADPKLVDRILDELLGKQA